MEETKMRVRITLTEEMLGMASGNPDIHREYIASRVAERSDDRLTESMMANMTEEEIQAVIDASAEKGMTVFPRGDNGEPIMWDYQIKGFFKDACKMLRADKKSHSAKMKAYKQNIDGRIFVDERKIPIVFDGEMGDCQRPLRAETMQGPRTALAESETVPAGSVMCFTVATMLEEDMETVREWLNYGVRRGFGQWRNSGKGKFVWEELDEEGRVIGGNKKTA